MCAAGQCGLRRCAISEMPLAQKRGSSAAPLTLLGEFRAELAEHRADMHADFLEKAPAHHAGDAAAKIGRAVAALPRRAHEAAGRAGIERRRRLVLEALRIPRKSGRAVPRTRRARCLRVSLIGASHSCKVRDERCEPPPLGAGVGGGGAQKEPQTAPSQFLRTPPPCPPRVGEGALTCRVHGVSRKPPHGEGGRQCFEDQSNFSHAPVCRIASVNTIAAAVTTLSERKPARHRHPHAGLRGGVEFPRRTGAFAAEDQRVACGKRKILEVAPRRQSRPAPSARPTVPAPRGSWRGWHGG